MTAHTPGPWVVAHRVMVEGGPDNSLVARALTGELSPEIAESNARLIVAAPDLLAALAALVKWMDASGQSFTRPVGGDTVFQTKPVEYSVVADARAALAKVSP